MSGDAGPRRRFEPPEPGLLRISEIQRSVDKIDAASRGQSYFSFATIGDSGELRFLAARLDGGRALGLNGERGDRAGRVKGGTAVGD